ncbi:putative membrane protein [Malaciobacter halophilus]|nr:putative membrane protein [Malaciobacter halophilus]
MNFMNLDKVIAGFFIILAMTINFGFFYGDMDSLEMHSKYELFAAIIINIIATTLKLGDKTQMGSVLLATSLVADIQLIAAAVIWTVAEYAYTIDREIIGMIISLSGGALLANITSVTLYVGETIKSKR